MARQTDEFGQKLSHQAAVLAEMEAALWKAVEILGTEFVARAICANTWPKRVAQISTKQKEL